MTDAIPATFICDHFCIGEALLFGVIHIFLTEEEKESLPKKTLFFLHQEASMTCFSKYHYEYYYSYYLKDDKNAQKTKI